MAKRRQTTNALKKIVGSGLAFSIRSFFALRPFFYITALRLLRKDTSTTVNRDTDMLIAGIGGCANTYASDAFEFAQPDLNLAHHLHVPAQVIRATKLGLPCLVLIRHPVDSIASITSRFQKELTVEGVGWAYKDYAYYYDSIIDLRDHFVAAEFQEVVTNFPAVIDRVNQRFGTNFTVPDNNSEEAKQIALKNKWSPPDREYDKDDVRVFLQRPQLEKERLAAEAMYRRFCTTMGIPMRDDSKVAPNPHIPPQASTG
jgi:hypothetical protein